LLATQRLKAHKVDRRGGCNSNQIDYCLIPLLSLGWH
jgi:hypothetical protein